MQVNDTLTPNYGFKPFTEQVLAWPVILSCYSNHTGAGSSLLFGIDNQFPRNNTEALYWSDTWICCHISRRATVGDNLYFNNGSEDTRIEGYRAAGQILTLVGFYRLWYQPDDIGEFCAWKRKSRTGNGLPPQRIPLPMLELKIV